MATFAAARRASLETRRAVAFRGFGGSVRLYSAPPAAAAEKPGADTPGAIFKTSVANKIGLAHALDGVMRSGAHDMKVFGNGTLAALASKKAYAKFAAAHYHFYGELERCLDDAAAGPHPTPSGALWAKFSTELRRAPALADDLRDLLGTTPEAHPPTPAVAAYMTRIGEAAKRETAAAAAAAAKGGGDGDAQPPLLVAHFYTRYLADLFGGSMLGWPTKRALGLPSVPTYYQHDNERVGARRGQYIESVYEAINQASVEAAGGNGGPEGGVEQREGLSESAMAEMVVEATESFRLNADIYCEDGRSSKAAAVWGGMRVLGGYATERVLNPGEQRNIFGRPLNNPEK
uniref:Uncharacterized protein n=1 Tax=Mantoniella antarctica TaxID=81844 RepID=A0A7S0SNZ9_9CHLO|mmetsp:Transcript_30821/g.77206  ORF Transcript_30821/g.77206 Transcript_30821/m.77206 type:complete len:347 (+) Transcript_30821:247-1287(+)|eukprot:CAMPEP_0181389058 /NCGR_PEP_ID=MMETSP1106-20121128/24677_1 /TAXON_ID=81844 /ORGANISM="Mantoniella antarctica, Strain SL-175" /LENGTH=346 /DNA_ID=CAMNT_0023509733 /DNA_START=239 /DNA_END=1279 /DNA_ORIENTATION=+